VVQVLGVGAGQHGGSVVMRVLTGRVTAVCVVQVLGVGAGQHGGSVVAGRELYKRVITPAGL